MKRQEVLFYELCDEIDYWKEKAKYWEAQHNELMDEFIASTNLSLEESKKLTGTLLTMALCSTEDKDGNIVISKKDRSVITKTIKTNKQ